MENGSETLAKAAPDCAPPDKIDDTKGEAVELRKMDTKTRLEWLQARMGVVHDGEEEECEEENGNDAGKEASSKSESADANGQLREEHDNNESVSEEKASKKSDVPIHEPGKGKQAKILVRRPEPEIIDLFVKLGRISQESIKDALHSLGLDPDHEELDHMWEHVGAEPGEGINIEQLEALMEFEHISKEKVEDMATEMKSSHTDERTLVSSTVESKDYGNDMYWVEIHKASLIDFKLGAHCHVMKVSEDCTAKFGIHAKDHLIMVENHFVDPRLSGKEVMKILEHRKLEHDSVRMKFRRHRENPEYTGEFSIVFPDDPSAYIKVKDGFVAAVEADSTAAHEGLARGDKFIIPSPEIAIDDEQFSTWCAKELKKMECIHLHLQHRSSTQENGLVPQRGCCALM